MPTPQELANSVAKIISVWGEDGKMKPQAIERLRLEEQHRITPENERIHTMTRDDDDLRAFFKEHPPESNGYMDTKITRGADAGSTPRELFNEHAKYHARDIQQTIKSLPYKPPSADLAHNEPSEQPQKVGHETASNEVAPPKPEPAPPAPEGHTPPATEVPPAEIAEGSTVLGKIGRIAGPVALVAPTLIESGEALYHAHKEGKGAAGIAKATAVGAGKGVADTFVPGARSGYSDVVGQHKHLTAMDRALNAVDHLSATATAVGGTAMAVEAAGVVTLPAEIPTAIGTGIAGLTNLGTNIVKAGLKVTGLAGQDQDGGYVYDGVAWAAEKAKHLVSGGESMPAGTAPHEVNRSATPATAQANIQRDGRH